VNDSLGHAVGDTLLQAYANKLIGCVRTTDTVARLGGDEFVVLLTDLNQGSESQITHAIATELQQALAQTLVLSGQTIKVEASIGIALYPDNADNFDALLKAADAAMYAAKRNQRGHYQFYSEEMNTAAQERFHLTQELHVALERNEFLLHYQPKVEVKTGKIVGAEALVRWQSPTRGLVPPGKFVNLMDEIGLATALGVWVLHTACAQLAAWDLMGLPSITVSINISPTQFEQTDIVAVVVNALAQHGLAHHRLELEILEGTAVEASIQTRNKLLGLQEQGVQMALDDFGTGYSSLVYLTRIPAKVLKLDQEFIRRLATDPRQAAIVASIILLAQGLGMQVVAEGVEEQAQLQILKDMDCDLFQGYLFSRPVPAAAFMEMLNKGDER
jgi:diguanylate cyclase (GGDEF)-like protein